MAALLGVLLIFVSAWCYGSLCIPPSWYRRRGERLALALGFGIAILSYGVLALGYLHLLFPGAILFFLILSMVVKAAIVGRRTTTIPPLGPRSTLAVDPKVKRWVGGISLTGVLLLYLFSLVEALSFDRCIDPYHVDFARSYLNNHRISFLAGSVVDCYPKLVEMLFAIGVLFEPESASSAIHITFLPLSALALFAAGKRVGGFLAGCFGALWIVAQVILHKYGPMGNVDLGAMFFCSALLVPLMHYIERGGLKDAALVGALAGFAIACKLTSILFVFVPVLAVFVLVAAMRCFRLSFSAWLGVLVFGATALAAESPWMIRNWVYTGSPFAPLLTNVFPIGPEFDRGLGVYHLMHAIQPERFLAKPLWTIDFFHEQLILEGTSAVVVLPYAILLLLGYALWKRSMKPFVCTVLGAIAFLGYVFAGPTRFPRFAAPAIPFFCLAAALATALLVKRLNGGLQIVFTTSFVVVSTVVVAAEVRDFREAIVHKPLLTAASREAYLKESDPTWERVQEINRLLSQQDRLCAHLVGLRFRHLTVPFSPPPFWGPDQAQFLWTKASSEAPDNRPARFSNLLHEAGITHLLVAKKSLIFPEEVFEVIRDWPDAVLYGVK